MVSFGNEGGELVRWGKSKREGIGKGGEGRGGVGDFLFIRFSMRRRKGFVRRRQIEKNSSTREEEAERMWRLPIYEGEGRGGCGNYLFMGSIGRGKGFVRRVQRQKNKRKEEEEDRMRMSI